MLISSVNANKRSLISPPYFSIFYLRLRIYLFSILCINLYIVCVSRYISAKSWRAAFFKIKIKIQDKTNICMIEQADTRRTQGFILIECVGIIGRFLCWTNRRTRGEENMAQT